MLKEFKSNNPNLYEFIAFNLLSNIATIVNFAVLNFCKIFLFNNLNDIGFVFGIFDYSVENGGLGSFLSFFISYALAQTVNYFIQRKFVFSSTNKKSITVIIYIITIILVYAICLYVPTIIMSPLTSMFGVFWGANLTNLVNIIIQVVINYPVMKFIVMKKY